MVKQYLREEIHHRLCSSCQNNSISNHNDELCEKCASENEIIKKKIIETMNHCEELLANQKLISKDKVQEEISHLYTIIDQRTTDLMEKIDKYQQELDDLLTTQEKTNETNA
jgi:hypothetical protein